MKAVRPPINYIKEEIELAGRSVGYLSIFHCPITIRRYTRGVAVYFVQVDKFVIVLAMNLRSGGINPPGAFPLLSGCLIPRKTFEVRSWTFGVRCSVVPLPTAYCPLPISASSILCRIFSGSMGPRISAFFHSSIALERSP